MQLGCSLVKYCITFYNTKYLQVCQDVGENNLTEVADDRKTQTWLALSQAIIWELSSPAHISGMWR
jgi:hypothetical protein